MISELVPVTTELFPLPFIIMIMIAGYSYTIQVLAATCTDSLHHAILHMSHPIMCDNRLGNMYNLRENMANSTGEWIVC
jgi:hypothetical protein